MMLSDVSCHLCKLDYEERFLLFSKHTNLKCSKCYMLLGQILVHGPGPGSDSFKMPHIASEVSHFGSHVFQCLQ